MLNFLIQSGNRLIKITQELRRNSETEIKTKRESRERYPPAL